MKYLKKSDLKFPQHKKTSHKGDNGRVLIVGGSQNYVGAMALAGLATLRTGVDIVTIAAPEKVAWAINCLSPDLMTQKFKGHYFKSSQASKVGKLCKNYDVILIGNGLGLHPETQKFVKKLSKLKILKVIDADGLKAIRIQEVDNSILTPHQKELEILQKNSRIKNLKELQKKLKNNVLLIKGPIDKIIAKNKIIYNKTGNEAMTVGGSGDVLAGLCAGFLAQTKDLWQAACLSAYINGAIGDYLKKKKGYSFIASDLVKDFEEITKKLKLIK